MWAFTGYPSPSAELTSIMDASFDFILLEGSITEPTKFRAILDIGIPGTCMRVQLDGCLGADSGLNDAFMTLQNVPGTSPHPTYSTSVVWSRESVGWFSTVVSQYDVIQIVDGEGIKLQPAYDAFVAQEKDKTYVTNELKSQVRGPRCPKLLGSLFTTERNPEGV